MSLSRSLLLALLVTVAGSTSPRSSTAGCPRLPLEVAKERAAGLAAEIRHHDDLYYRDLAPAISDQEYDHLFGELLLLETCFPSLSIPDSPTKAIGKDARTGATKIRHLRPMLSLNSSPSPEAVEELMRRCAAQGIQPRFLVQPKVDGLPVELHYQSGRLVSGATRGDGHFGEDVTEQIRGIAGIPQTLSGSHPESVVVRGEIYADLALMAAAAETGSQNYATPRHFAAGVLRSRHPDPQALAALRLFPFELVGAEAAPGASTDIENLTQLAEWGFPVRLDLCWQAETSEQVRQIFERYRSGRAHFPFAADGIVVKLNDLAARGRLGEGARAPFWAAAWKFPPITATTQVRSISWQVGRTGRRTPVAELDPVTVGGIVVSHVSLHNEETLSRLGIRIGDRIVVALVGDVIPQVQQVIKDTDDRFPATIPSHRGSAPLNITPSSTTPPSGTTSPSHPASSPGSALPPGSASQSVFAPVPRATGATRRLGSNSSVPQICLSDSSDCRKQFLARAQHFVSAKGLGIEGLGRKRLEALVTAGLVHDLPSLFRLRPGEVAEAPGFTGQSAKRLVAAIRRIGRPEPFRVVIAIGIPGVGPSTAKRLAGEFGSLDELLACKDEAKGGAAADTVRHFFATGEGAELLAGLREVGVL